MESFEEQRNRIATEVAACPDEDCTSENLDIADLCHSHTEWLCLDCGNRFFADRTGKVVNPND